MTKLVIAFAEVAKLPKKEQETLAEWVLEELASERQWTESFARSADHLEQLADEAIAEYGAGKSGLLDPDWL